MLVSRESTDSAQFPLDRAPRTAFPRAGVALGKPIGLLSIARVRWVKQETLQSG
jgi:hypothetical protein